MLSDDKTGLLQAFLGSLPEPMAARLAKAVEVDRLMDSSALPHELILGSLRPALRRVPLARTPTPQRLFCRPFEDILSATPRREKRKASIPRSSVEPIWQWMKQSLMPAEAKAYAAEIRNLVVTQDTDKAQAATARFAALVAARIEAALADPATRADVRKAFGDDAILADAAEVALLLSVAPQIFEIQALLPKYMPGLGESELRALREIYDRLIGSYPDAAPYVAVIAMNRLARPWEALRFPLMIARATQDTLISKTDMGLVGEILFARLDALQTAILTARHPEFEAEELVENVASFAELSSAIVKEIEVRRDGDWGQRLLKDRATVGNVMDGFMDRAFKEIAGALPVQKSGFTGGAKTPDFSKPVNAEKRNRALRYARLVIGCRPFAAAASFGAKQKNAQEEAAGYLRQYNEDVVREMRVADRLRREIVSAQLALAAELTALLFSEGEAELLRRRGRAAVANAA